MLFFGGDFFFGRMLSRCGQAVKKKHVILEGSSSFLAVSKPKQQKAENKAALCV